MVRQPSAAKVRELAIALHDIAWLMPRKLDPWAEAGNDPLPQSELEVLRLLIRVPGQSVGELAQELGMHSSNVSATVRTLVGRGLLERQTDTRDGRIARLAPTAKARAIARQREEAWGELLRARLRRLHPEEVAQLLAATDSLAALVVNLAGKPS